MTGEKEKRARKKLNKIKVKTLMRIGQITALLILAVLIFYIINFSGGLTSDNNKWGTFGDFFGGTLNPILSFIALLALLYTIKIQQDALEITHEELELTREEMKNSSDALKEQSDSLKLQNFENRFFNLIQSHKHTASNFRIPGPLNEQKVDLVGKICFKTFHWSYNKSFRDTKTKTILQQKGGLAAIEHSVRAVIMKFDFLYYFYEHIDLIDSLLAEKPKLESSQYLFYSNLIKRQYSNHELFFLYFFHDIYMKSRYTEFLTDTGFFDGFNHVLYLDKSLEKINLYGK